MQDISMFKSTRIIFATAIATILFHLVGFYVFNPSPMWKYLDYVIYLLAFSTVIIVVGDARREYVNQFVWFYEKQFEVARCDATQKAIRDLEYLEQQERSCEARQPIQAKELDDIRTGAGWFRGALDGLRADIRYEGWKSISNMGDYSASVTTTYVRQMIDQFMVFVNSVNVTYASWQDKRAKSTETGRTESVLVMLQPWLVAIVTALAMTGATADICKWDP